MNTSDAATAELDVGQGVVLHEDDVEWAAVRAAGPGGQHVNKASTAVELRFNVRASSLPAECKGRLLAVRDRRLSQDGVLVLKAQRFRSQKLNRQDAMRRLTEWIAAGLDRPAIRRPTRIPRAARKRRLENKSHRGTVKRLRGKVGHDPDR